jgi:hypothetical protein
MMLWNAQSELYARAAAAERIVAVLMEQQMCLSTSFLGSEEQLLGQVRFTGVIARRRAKSATLFSHLQCHMPLS